MADGWCTMTVTDNSNNKHQLSFLVMNTKQNSLLSMNTCFDIRLIKISETVHLVSEEPLEYILREYENDNKFNRTILIVCGLSTKIL